MNTLEIKTKAMQSQRGYSLIELSLVLAVIAILLVASLAGVQRILRSNTVNTTLKESTSAVAAIITQTIRQPSFAGVTIQNMSGLGVWEPERVTSSGTATATVTNPFGGPVYVDSSTVTQGGYGTGQTYKYTIANVPIQVCSDLVQGLDSMAYAIGVRNSASPPAAPGGGALTGTTAKAAGANAIILSSLSTACASAGNKDIDLIIARN